MAYTLSFTEEAKKDIRGLEHIIAKLIYKKITAYASLDNVRSVSKKLVGYDEGDCRFRVGDYRVLYTLKGKVIEVFAVENRKDAYR